MTKYSQIEIVENIICDYFIISSESLIDRSRKRNIIEARQIFHYFMRNYTNFSFKSIGEYKNIGFDFNTIRHSIITVNNRIDTEKEYREKIELLDSMIKDRIEIECFQTLADNSYKNQLIKEIINAKTINGIKIILQNRLN